MLKMEVGICILNIALYSDSQIRYTVTPYLSLDAAAFSDGELQTPVFARQRQRQRRGEGS